MSTEPNPLGLGKKAIQVGAGVKTKMPFMERVTSTVSDGIGKALTGSWRVLHADLVSLQ